MQRTAVGFLRQGRLDEAANLYQALLKANPRDVECLRDLGSIRLREGRYEEAAELIRRALARTPNSAGLETGLGVALAGLGRYREAIRHYRKALALDPASVDAQANIGAALLALQDAQAAIPIFEKLIAAQPDHIAAYLGLGEALEGLGRRDAALGVLKAALPFADRNGLLHRRIAECHRYVEGDPHLGVMEAMLAEAPPLPAADRVHLHAGLAKAYEDLGLDEPAFGHALEGNRIQRQRFTYREAETVGLLQRIQARFTPQLMTALQGMGHQSAAPIFIVGMPRSGSTLVEQILASHPMVFGAGEIRSFDTAVTSLGLGRVETDAFLDALPSLTKRDLHRLGASYLASIDAAPASARRFTNKLLGNFLNVGLIHLALPNARIVHIRRDAMDTCVSRFTKLMVPGQAYSYDLAELGRYHRAYETLMDHWRTLLPQGVMLEVSYEEVVGDLEGQARRLIAHCGLEWDAACLSFHKTERAVMTPSKSQVRQPLYASAVGRWRRHADALRPLREALEHDGF
jgi:thioredoxin-like negative regulator of GroEL